MSGKGAKLRRMERRRQSNAGSENVRKKRKRYQRWSILPKDARNIASHKGERQFIKSEA